MLTETLPPHGESPAARFPLSPATLGVVYCILSAVFYTLMGICQRELSTTADPVWVNCVQASVSTIPSTSRSNHHG